MANLTLQQQKELFFFSCLSLLFVYPIIQANVYYADDLSRIVNGHTYWHELGRPFATIIQKIISLNFRWGVLDVGTLNQIFSALLLALTAFTFNEYLKREFKNGMFFLSLVIVLNPFYLDNLSYRFDSLGMTLGLFVCVYAFYLPLKHKVIPVFFLIISLSFYQSNINFFIALSAVEFILLSNHQRFSFIYKQLFTRITQYCVATIIYLILISKMMGNHSRNQLVSISFDGLEQVINNIEQYINLMVSFFSSSILVSLLLFVLITIFYYVKFYWRKGKLHFYLLVPLLAIILYLISIAGPMLLLENQSPFYRIMPSFYMFTALLMAMSYMTGKKYSYSWVIPILIPISISFQYGIALGNQRDYDKNLMMLVQSDLLKHNKLVPVYVLGQSQRAPHAKKITAANSYIDNSIKPASGWVAASLLIENGVSQAQFLWSKEYKKLQSKFNDDLCHKHIEVISQNILYSIYSTYDKIYVLLDSNKNKYCN